MTAREHLLIIIADFHDTYGYAPSMRELMELRGIASVSTIYYQLREMKSDGLVDWVPGQVRTLHLTREGIEALGRKTGLPS